MKKGVYSWSIIIISLGIILRLVPLVHNPLWTDEFWSLYFAKSLTWKEVFFTAPVANDIHPGFYYAIVKLLIPITNNAATLRSLTSLLPQLVVIVLLLIWGIRRLPHRLTLFVTAVFSFSPFIILFSWQIRMYSLMMLTTTISGIMLYEYIVYKNRRILLYMPLVTAISHSTHISGYLLTASLLLAVFARSYLIHKTVIHVLKEHATFFVVIFLTTIITLVPYYPFKFSSMFFRASWLPKTSPMDAVAMFPVAALGITTRLSPDAPGALPNHWITVVSVAIGILLLWQLGKIRSLARNNLIGMLILVLFPPLAVFIFSQLAPDLRVVPFVSRFVPRVNFYITRLFLPQTVFLYISASWMLYEALRTKKTRVLGLLATVVISIVWLINYIPMNIASPIEQLHATQRRRLLLTLDTPSVVFYPSYYSLALLDPEIHIPLDSIADIYNRSSQFEEFVKNSLDKNLVCASITSRPNDTRVSIVAIHEPSSFFQTFRGRFAEIMSGCCIMSHQSSYATIFTGSCRQGSDSR